MNWDITNFGNILMRFLCVKKWKVRREEKIVIFIICLLGVFLSATFCGGNDNETGYKGLMAITKVDNSKEIILHEGERFRIELEELGSAG